MIRERFPSDSAPSPILQPQSDTRGHKAYVVFVFFVAKNKRNKTMKLHEAIRGMEVKSWERRENSSGKCTVYVRFAPKKPAPTISVKEVA